MFSRQATWSGNTVASRSSLRMRCDLRRGFLAATEARQRQRGDRVPAPARAEQRRVEQGLGEHVVGAGRVQVAGHFLQREAVAGGQRQHDRVLGRRGLQLEVELAAEALAQRQSPGAVDAAAERRVDHQLGAAGFVEEALEHDGRLGRQYAERGLGGGEVVGQLLRGGGRRAAPTLLRAAMRPVAASRTSAGIAAGRRSPRAGAKRPATARRCARAPRPARTGCSAACRGRLPPAAGRAPRAGCGSWCCRAGRCRRPGSRPRSPRAPSRSPRPAAPAPPGSRRCREWRRRR